MRWSRRRARFIRGRETGGAAPRRRGLFLVDVIIGLALLAMLTVIFTVAVARQNSAARRLADQREAVRLAEAALTSLQSGTPLPQGSPDARVSVRELSDPPPSAANRWVEARADCRGRTATLIGMGPAGAVDRAAATQPDAAATTPGVEP